MGYVIHMDIEATEQMARNMVYRVTDLLDSADMLHYQVSRLNDAWQNGGASSSLVASFDRVVRQLNADISELDHLASRVNQEIGEWKEMDAVGNPVLNYIKENFSIEDIAKIGVATYFATHLKTSLSRPNSIILNGPNILPLLPKSLPKVVREYVKNKLSPQALREFIGINKKTNIIKPINLAKQMLPVALVGMAIDTVPQIVDDFNTYGGLNGRFASAASVDFAVKGALSLAATGIAVGLSVGLAAVGAPVLLAGGIVLVTGVGLSIGQDKIWNNFTESGARDKAIETVLRVGNQAKNLVTDIYQRSADTVQNAFDGFIKSLTQPSASIPATI